MFGMGMPEIMLILAVALIVIGPKKLPDLAKSLGRALGEFRRATTEFKETMEENTGLKEVKKAINDMNIKNAVDISPKPEKKPIQDLSGNQPVADKATPSEASENSEKPKIENPDIPEYKEKKQEGI